MSAVVVDANVLVLLVVGTVDRSLIAKHKRTRRYDAEAYELLTRYLATFGSIVVTPNVLTEASNLLQDERDLRPLTRLKQWLARLDERFVASEDAAANPHFLRLGLTDAGLLCRPASEGVLLTDDLDLYLAATQLGREAINFTHLRSAILLGPAGL
jgi:hypothetical protein